MKKFLAPLFLCFSPLAFSADLTAGKAPWLNNTPTAGQSAAIAPQQPALGALRDMQFQAPEKADWIDESTKRLQMSGPKSEASNDTSAQDFDMQVFISAGMPDGVLRHLFKQALNHNPNRIRFVVRGFEPQKVGVLLNKLRKLLPDPYKDEVVLEIDPNAFRAYGIEAVPVYLVKDAGKWFEIRGTASLDAAREYARKGGAYNAGDLYPIAEPDILSVIEDRAKKYDWEPAMKRAQERVAQNLRPSFDLPASSRNATTYFAPTFTVPHDITAPAQGGKGEVLIARAGQTFALLDHTRLQVPVIVFDATDQRQLLMVEQWVKRPEYKNADLFVIGSTSIARDPKTPVTLELARVLKRPVYPMMQRLAQRFGVESVPAIVEQEGRSLRIRYFDVTAGAAQ